MNRVSIKKLPSTIVVSSRAASLEAQRSRTWTSTLHRGQRDCCCCVSPHPLEGAEGCAPPQISQVCASSILRATAACRSWLFFIQVILATTVLLTLALSLPRSLTRSHQCAAASVYLSGMSSIPSHGTPTVAFAFLFRRSIDGYWHTTMFAGRTFILVKGRSATG